MFTLKGHLFHVNRLVVDLLLPELKHRFHLHAHKVPAIRCAWFLMLSVLIPSASASPSAVFISGRPRVWLQLQRLLCVPEPQQDRRGPLAEQSFEPFENQVGEGSQEHQDWESLPQTHTHANIVALFNCELPFTICIFDFKQQEQRTWKYASKD